VDYVVFAPEGQSVEDLERHEVMSALRDKTPYGDLFEGEEPAAADGSDDPVESIPTAATSAATASTIEAGRSETEETDGETDDTGATANADETADPDVDDTSESNGTVRDDPSTLRGHVRAVIESETGSARLLDDAFETIETVPAADAFDAVSGTDSIPYAVVLDGELTQRLLDVAAQRGVEQFVARSSGEMVKTPVDVRVRTVDQLAAAD